ncbi:MAG TPA: hypothetical protein VHZ54_00730 [Solirubrobacterales bacterium]|jgi:hypothetical protein|nr:hypothetical protein [Solirubrobacterales bacterium]
MKRFRPRLTYANVIASLALFIALGGAAVAAGLPKNSVGPNQIKKGAVTGKAIRKAAVTSGKIAPNAVVAGKIGPNAVLPGNLGAGIINTSKIAAGAVNAEKIANNVVTTNKLNNKAVTAAKIAEKGVATGNLAESAVTTGKLADGAVTAAKLNAEVLNNVNPLKSGQTLRGVFDLGGYETATEATPTTGEPPVARGAISYQQSLVNPPAPFVVPKGGPYPAQCPGLGGGETTPAAAPGWLCIYLTNESNLEGKGSEALGVDTTNRLGIGLSTKAKKESKGDYLAAGVWAVTAP